MCSLVLLVVQGTRGLLVGIVIVVLLLRVRLLRLLGDKRLSYEPSLLFGTLKVHSLRGGFVQEIVKASGRGVGTRVSSSVEGEEGRILAVERKVKSCTREVMAVLISRR